MNNIVGERPLTKDNNILGQIYLQNIPPGPSRSQSFDEVFDIDADGVLTVTSIHVQTGKQQSLTLNSKTSGRMSTAEINEVIAKAEMMREADEKKAKRVVARTALETFCQELRFSFSSADSKSQILMNQAQDCLIWLKQNREASEDTFQEKLAQLERDSGLTWGLLNNSYGATRLTLESCFSSGKQCLSQSDIPGAYEWFYKAYKQAGSQEKEKQNQAVLMICKACRKYAKMEADPGEVEKLILRGASLLIFELKAGAMTSFCFELVAKLGKLKDIFIKKVSNSSVIKCQPLCNLNT